MMLSLRRSGLSLWGAAPAARIMTTKVGVSSPTAVAVAHGHAWRSRTRAHRARGLRQPSRHPGPCVCVAPTTQATCAAPPVPQALCSSGARVLLLVHQVRIPHWPRLAVGLFVSAVGREIYETSGLGSYRWSTFVSLSPAGRHASLPLGMPSRVTGRFEGPSTFVRFAI